MGIVGLTSYLNENYEFCFKPYQLHDCHVVIDGSNCANYLLRKLKGHDAFGGDYDEFFALYRSFILDLKKCNISPIFFIDGVHEEANLGRKLVKRRSKVGKLSSFCKGFSTEELNSVFSIQVFLNVIRNQGFTCIQCDFCARQNVAAAAASLNCPVLSYDSDFFIYGVRFIPLDKINLTPVKHSNSDKYYFQCSVFNVDDFLKSSGLEKEVLFVLATLMYHFPFNNSELQNFFNKIQMPLKPELSHNKKKIHSLIQWLKNENVNSAKKYILSHVKEKHVEKVSKMFDIKQDHYSIPEFETLSDILAGNCRDACILKIDWPKELNQLYCEFFIPSFVRGMIFYQNYLTPLQVEDLNDKSPHLKAWNLIKIIYTMITPYVKNKRPLEVYLMDNKKYNCRLMKSDQNDDLNLNTVLKEPWERRLKLLCDIVCIPMDDVKFVPCNSWAVITLGLMYWIKECQDSVSPAHIHAFVMMIIANQIVQVEVGYYNSELEFMKCCGDELTKLKNTMLTLDKSRSFKEMLKNVTHYECLLAQKELIPLRQTTEQSCKQYSVSTIHLFNCFQTILYHIMIINSLLNHPLPHLHIEDFYSGTLLFNLYLGIKSTSTEEKFGSNLFLQMPNLNQIYKFLSQKLCEVLEKCKKKKEFSWRRK